MRSTFSQLFIAFFFLLIYFSCANIKPPQGGPKDTIPPVLVKSVPLNKSLNYKSNSIRLTYNEYLKVDNLKKNLIVTPMGDLDFEEKVRKNTIEITFIKPLRDSTTYTLNFQTAVKDITEGNISTDNTFAFSTGNYIDSLHISGLTKDLLTLDSLKNITVGLYDVYDTFNLFKGRPLYFTRSSDKGLFLIDNIKAGKYFIQAFNDGNNNLQCDVPKESFGYETDTITLKANIDSVRMQLIPLDIRPLKMIKALPSGKYFEVGFNKSIIEYSVTPFDSSSIVYYNLINQNKGIRFYSTLNADSIRIILHAMDSVEYSIDSTFYVKFQESKRKKEGFSFKMTPQNKSEVPIDFKGAFAFTKPVLSVNTDSLFIRYDTLHMDTLRLNKDIFFNVTRDTLFIKKTFNKEWSVAKKPADEKEQNEPGKNLPQRAQPSSSTGPVLYAGTGAFISVDNDTSKVISYSYGILKEEKYGIIRGTIATGFDSFFIQLLDNKNKVIYQINSQKEYSFINIPEGQYHVRVLIDNNNNGRWDPGDYYKGQIHEGVYFYPEALTIRANWELRDIDLSF
jgi:uncharacterized protein (DUF2141 family)